MSCWEKKNNLQLLDARTNQSQFVSAGTFEQIELSLLMASSCGTHLQHVSAGMCCHMSVINSLKGKIPACTDVHDKIESLFSCGLSFFLSI